jgi:hypothetical protein
MLKEGDPVVLTRDMAEYWLKLGDIGFVVHCYPETDAFEVAFFNAEGKTVAILTLSIDDIRTRNNDEILHVREFAPLGQKARQDFHSRRLIPSQAQPDYS